MEMVSREERVSISVDVVTIEVHIVGTFAFSGTYEVWEIGFRFDICIVVTYT